MRREKSGYKGAALFPGSSAVEQPAVNRLVAGSIPARGANIFNTLRKISNWTWGLADPRVLARESARQAALSLLASADAPKSFPGSNFACRAEAGSWSGERLAFSFLTPDASEDVKLVHRDVAPVQLPDEAERKQWMNAPMKEALLLQKPPAAGALKIVATDTKQYNAP